MIIYCVPIFSSSVQEELLHYPWCCCSYFSKMLKLYVVVLCDGQGTFRQAILYTDRSFLEFSWIFFVVTGI